MSWRRCVVDALVLFNLLAPAARSSRSTASSRMRLEWYNSNITVTTRLVERRAAACANLVAIGSLEEHDS